MCTLEKHDDIFLLTLTGDDQHLLNPAIIGKIGVLLHQVRIDAKPGSVLITTAEGKFFSNGLDLAWALEPGADPLERLRHMVECFRTIMADMLSLPLPTIAAVNGHAAAAGFMIAISHDYFLMRKDRGFLYMSELDIGSTLPDYFMAMMRSKITSPKAQRNVVLQAAKVKPIEAMGMGIIDSVHESPEETLEAALQLGKKLSSRKWIGEVYAEIRKASFPEVCQVLGLIKREAAVARL